MNQEILQANIQQVQETIEKNAPENSNVDLIAVTKYIESDVLRKMVDSGISKVAENRTESLLEKQEELGELSQSIEWHFVGRLQTRPVRKIINQIDYLHSLDRMSLIKEVNKRAEQPVKCFLQVNVSGEEQKAGFNQKKSCQS